MATTYTVTNSFSAGTTAVASEVNQNFTDVLTALNSFDITNCTGTIALARISNLTSSQMAAAFFKDEDDMASDSATAVSSQQAIKAYVDTEITAISVKGWVHFDGTDATPDTGKVAYNVSSITDNGAGDYTINWTTDFSTANYAVGGLCGTDGSGYFLDIVTQAAGSVRVKCRKHDGTVGDQDNISVWSIGTQ